jgi:DNA-binding MarR family transcriptional regulator
MCDRGELGQCYLRDVPERRDSVAFLLAQVGAAAAERFGERVAALGLSRAQAGLLRVLARNEPMSQQALAEHLDLVPSRLVVLVDELAEQRVVERRPDESDRRAYALHLTSSGRELIARLGQVAREHDQTFCKALTELERGQLADALRRLAEAHGLRANVHPGYRKMGAPEEASPGAKAGGRSRKRTKT